MPESFSLTSSWHRHQEWAAFRKLRSLWCGCRAQLLYCLGGGASRAGARNTERSFGCFPRDVYSHEGSGKKDTNLASQGLTTKRGTRAGYNAKNNEGQMGEEPKEGFTKQGPITEHRGREQFKRTNRVSRNIEISWTGGTGWGGLITGAKSII